MLAASMIRPSPRYSLYPIGPIGGIQRSWDRSYPPGAGRIRTGLAAAVAVLVRPGLIEMIFTDPAFEALRAGGHGMSALEDAL
jgi:hypothetical protein